MSANNDVPVTKDLFRSVMPTTFGVVAFVLSFICTVGCDAIKFSSTSGSAVTVEFGFWTHEGLDLYQDTDGDNYAIVSCTGYSDDVQMDSIWKASAAFSVIPLILGGLVFIGKCCTACSNQYHCFDSVGYLLAFLFQGLSLLFLESDACKSNPVLEQIETSNSTLQGDIAFQETCSASTGMKCAIAATVFWLLAAFASAQAFWVKKQKEYPPLSQTEPFLIGESVMY